MKRTLLLNRWRTPDRTILISRNRHDYQEHKDKNGQTYAIDGGTDYIRLIGDTEDLESLCLYDDSPHSTLREHICWGSYGKSGAEPLQWIPISKMSREHIQAVLNTQRISPAYRKLFERELSER